MAELLGLPSGATITGRPLTLLDAISTTPDRRQQLQATHDYWRLTAALAEYRFALEENAQLQRVEAKSADAALLRTARTAATAALRTAELAAVTAQHQLAEAAMLPTSSPLPLPTDVPHVGPYRTYFDQMFGSGTAPGRTRLIHRVLPVRLQTVEARVAAVEATEQAVLGTLQAYQSGEADLSAVLAALAQWGRQRRALIAAVCDYNHDIADYAFAVASPAMSGQALVAMLIKTGSSQTQKSVPAKGGSSQVAPPTEPQHVSTQPSGDPPSAVQPATFDQPVPDKTGDAPARSSTGQPTLAPPRPTLPSPGTNEPAPAPAQPPASKAAEPAGTKASEPAARTALRLAESDRRVVGASSPLYSTLAEIAPAARAKHLALALHADRTASVQAGESIDLERCLQGAPNADRRQLIDAYWLARQRAAECQAWVDHGQVLDPLVSGVLANRDARGGAAAMLRLQAARLAAAAEQSAAQAKLLEASFDLTRRAGRPQDAAWLLPVTVPHSGPYLLQLDAQRRELVDSWRLRRLAATIPAWLADLQDRATAVVQADAARAAAAIAYPSARGTLDRVLTCAERQMEETVAFLSGLTAYNQAIADYALSVLPSATPADQLVRTLVVMK